MKNRAFDDILDKEDKKAIKHIKQLEQEKQSKCPFLRKEGKYWYYCGHGLKRAETLSRDINESNPIFYRHVEAESLELYCMDDYKECPRLRKKSKT